MYCALVDLNETLTDVMSRRCTAGVILLPFDVRKTLVGRGRSNSDNIDVLSDKTASLHRPIHERQTRLRVLSCAVSNHRTNPRLTMPYIALVTRLFLLSSWHGYPSLESCRARVA